MKVDNLPSNHIEKIQPVSEFKRILNDTQKTRDTSMDQALDSQDGIATDAEVSRMLMTKFFQAQMMQKIKEMRSALEED